MTPTLRAWLAARPPAVRAVAAQYPPGSPIRVRGRAAFVVAYPEFKDGSIGLGVSYTDPREDFDAAMASRFPVCPCCLAGEHGDKP